MICYLDPGGTTGWAYFYHDVFDSGQDDFLHTGLFLENITRNHQEKLSLGWEAFIITVNTARKPGSQIALEVIGVARYHALKNHCTVLPAYPSSSIPHASVRDKQLKSIGWHKPGRDHANDASLHLMHYLLKEKQLPAELVAELANGVS